MHKSAAICDQINHSKLKGNMSVLRSPQVSKI